MKTYIALFRGINMGGHAILPMKDLVALLETLGMRNVTTYIQSGNAVFHSRPVNTGRLSKRISKAIGDSHGFEPHVILLQPAELERAIASNPFPEAESDPRTLHVYFLDAVPAHPDLAALERVRKNSERFCYNGNIFYLHTPDGAGTSKLAAKVEKSLGVVVTARNWRTVCKLMDIAGSMNT